MQSAVLTTNNLNENSIIFTQPKLDKNKKLSVGILNSETKSAVYIETELLRTPFGVGFYDGGKNIAEEAKSYSLLLKEDSEGNENYEKSKKLFDFLESVDNNGINHVITHSQTIFKKKYTQEQKTIVEDMLFNKCVKRSAAPDGTPYPRKITLKIMRNENMDPDVLVFKDSPKPIENLSFDDLVNLIPKNVLVKAIIQLRFYIVNGKAGINIRVLQIKISTNEKVGRPISYAFSDGPSDAVALKAADTVALKSAETVALKHVEENAADSEEEEDSEVEVESS
jgi:hypothetical protein